ncbi:hypothetical protein AB0M46_14105 [Dactylosporangium sp. NPDC051485]|uniref:hypothetical protein n=1 Tax=Dactylosporangium sp. NPDC051485 TaxID=3154846 RepID=UPI003434B449
MGVKDLPAHSSRGVPSVCHATNRVAALAWIGLGPGRARRVWIGSALAATGALTVVGLLSATGVIGRLVIG